MKSNTNFDNTQLETRNTKKDEKWSTLFKNQKEKLQNTIIYFFLMSCLLRQFRYYYCK